MRVKNDGMRAVVVDDSASMRELLKMVLTGMPGTEVVASFETSEEAWRFIRDHRVDLLLLDLELPGKSGLELLNHCRQNKSVPTIVISARIVDDPTLAREAMQLGAIAALPKPDGRNTTHQGLLEQIMAAVKSWRETRKKDLWIDGSQVSSLIAIGASTGGVPAVQRVLSDLRGINVPILITQHMSSTYTPRFAESISKLLNRNAVEAVTGMPVNNRFVYVAPGSAHMRVVRRDGHLEFSLGEDAPISGHRPSVDAMFTSLAKLPGLGTIAILLTGMGSDGAEGMLRLRQAGARTVAQDERSSVVFGMPRAAAELKAAELVLSIEAIGGAVAEMLAESRRIGRVA